MEFYGQRSQEIILSAEWILIQFSFMLSPIAILHRRISLNFLLANTHSRKKSITIESIVKEMLQWCESFFGIYKRIRNQFKLKFRIFITSRKRRTKNSRNVSQRECEKAEIVVKVCGGDDSLLCRIIGKLFNGKSLHSHIDEIMPMFTHLPTSHCVVLVLTTEQKSIGNIYSFNHDGMSNGIFQAAFLLLSLLFLFGFFSTLFRWLWWRKKVPIKFRGRREVECWMENPLDE